MAELLKPLILIVDDDQHLREIIKTKLGVAGFEVAEASGGEEGWTKIQEIIPDLVLLDINMPDLNGLKLFSRLKQDQNLAKIKVVFLTSYGEPQTEAVWLDKKFAREIGALGYIKKTDDLDKIISEVKSFLPPPERDQ